MEPSIITYSEDVPTIPEFITNVRQGQAYFKFVVNVSDVQSHMTVVKIKDYFYNEAILNLIKKSKFLQLYIQLIDNQITEEEYDNELKENSGKYFINLKDLQSEFDFLALVSIMQTLPKDLSMDDVSEIFGIKIQSLQRSLNF